MTVKSDSLQKKVSLDTPLFGLLTVNWEMVLYATFIVLAVVTRFYDLGARVMSHDESLHTLYSWNLYAGKGYQHDPLMHGPFLFHITALFYFLFGDNDFTARVATALFGVALVILPYWFRPWLGRLGALSASFMLLISPGLLYYSRYIRHDIFISVWTVLMILAFFQYMRTRAGRWLFIGAAAVAFMLSTKEVAFIHGFIGVTFILLTWMWESLPKPQRQWVSYGLVGLIAVLAIAITYMAGQADALTVLPPEGETTGGFNPWKYVDVMIMIMALLIGAVIIQRGVDRSTRPVTNALLSLRERVPDIIKAVILAVIIFTLLYTTFFSNIGGLATGSVGAVKYWLGQQEVQRGGQPWYYYLFLVPLYEFLPVLAGIIGGPGLPGSQNRASRPTPATATAPPRQGANDSPGRQVDLALGWGRFCRLCHLLDTVGICHLQLGRRKNALADRPHDPARHIFGRARYPNSPGQFQLVKSLAAGRSNSGQRLAAGNSGAGGGGHGPTVPQPVTPVN